MIILTSRLRSEARRACFPPMLPQPFAMSKPSAVRRIAIPAQAAASGMSVFMASPHEP
jgi:hypothetical protein